MRKPLTICIISLAVCVVGGMMYLAAYAGYLWQNADDLAKRSSDRDWYHQELRDVTWRVTGLSGEGFILDNPRGSMVFRFGSHRIAGDAISKICKNALSDQWFVVPDTASRAEGQNEPRVTGSAWREGKNMEGELVRIGALLESATTGSNIGSR